MMRRTKKQFQCQNFKVVVKTNWIQWRRKWGRSRSRKLSLRNIWWSVISCGLFIILKLPCWVEQLNDLKSLQTSVFQLIFDCMLVATVLQIASWHSGGGRFTTQSSCVAQPSRWGIEGAAEMRKRIGDATSSDVTRSVTPVSVILWNVVDVFRNCMHGPQNSQLSSRVLSCKRIKWKTGFDNSIQNSFLILKYVGDMCWNALRLVLIKRKSRHNPYKSNAIKSFSHCFKGTTSKLRERKLGEQ